MEFGTASFWLQFVLSNIFASLAALSVSCYFPGTKILSLEHFPLAEIHQFLLN